MAPPPLPVNAPISSQERLALQMIDDQRRRNLQQMFTGTSLLLKKQAAAKRAKEIADEARKASKAVSAIGLPSIDLPTISLPSLPAIALPGLSLPSIGLPDVGLPQISLPDIDLPDINLPDVNLPDIEFPNLELPTINFPGIGTINLEIPGIRAALRLLMELLGSFDLGEIAFAIGADLVLEFLSGAAPVLGQVKACADAAREWGKASRKAYALLKHDGRMTGVLPGDPAEAAEALRVVIRRFAVMHTEMAVIRTGQATVGTAGLLLDFGAATGPATSALAAVGKMAIKVHWAGREYREVKTANLVLAVPADLARMGAGVFKVSPILGCYLLVNSNTSDIVNLLTSDIGRAGWMTDVEQMKRKKIDPLIKEANAAIIASPYELHGLKMNKIHHPPSIAQRIRKKLRF